MYKLIHNGLTTAGKMSDIHSFIRNMWGNEAEILATGMMALRHSVIHKVTRAEIAVIHALPDEDNMTLALREKVRECVN